MEDSKQEIVEAARSALKKHGYADLSIQKIADEFEKSKSLLYHHYDGKDEMLHDLMETALDEFSDCCLGESEGAPDERLREKAFIGFDFGDTELAKAVAEIRVQGVRDEDYRKKFRKFSEKYREKLAEIIREGQKKEVFNTGIDPEAAAEFIEAVNSEAMFLSATETSSAGTRKELENYIEKRILE